MGATATKVLSSSESALRIEDECMGDYRLVSPTEVIHESSGVTDQAGGTKRKDTSGDDTVDSR